MASPENNVINLRPEAPMVKPERPCWAVYEYWVTNEKGRKLRPGVYRHGFKRVAGQDDSEDDNDGGDRPTTDEWISSPVTVAARTTNSDDGSEGRFLRLVTESGIMAPADVQQMRAAGVHAFLVGEAFMRAAEPGEALAALFG